MAKDELSELIAAARAAVPEIPDSAWRRFEDVFRETAGGRSIYIQARKKERLLQKIADIQGTQLRLVDRAAVLGISVRSLTRLRKIG